MKKLKGKVAVVTGASSGIGRELAVGLAKEGCRLALADIDNNGLLETERMIKAENGECFSSRVDVSKREEMHSFAELVIQQYGVVDILINNAGVVFTSTIEDMPYEDLERVMNINFWGAVYGTKAFLGHLKKQASSNLVNISSVYGLWGMATQSAYNASKFALRGFTEALMQEMRCTGLHVTCVYPGGVKTNIVRNSGSRLINTTSARKDVFADTFDKTAMTTPGKAARIIISGIKKNRKRILIGPDAFLFDISQRLFPTLYQKLGPFVMRRMGLNFLYLIFLTFPFSYKIC